jgi:hypothetical protein
MSRLTKVIIAAGITMLIAAVLFGVTTGQPVATQSVQRPFMCRVPYRIDYCQAHQDEMYAKQ